MAVHRRPLVDGPPLELVEFRPDDWLPAVGDVSPYEAWLKARFEWAKAHPDDFRLNRHGFSAVVMWVAALG
jgi:hypothetical protein